MAGAAWITTALLPTHLLALRTEPVADRLLYLPMVGVAMIAAALAEAVAERRGRWVIGAVAATLVVTLGGLTVARNIEYQSEVALWEDAARKAPQNPRAHVNLGYAWELAGAPDRAEREYRAALALQPGLWWAEHGLRALDEKRQAAQGGER
jgi:tetratricopeptide (TPR) repeat protein